jgi:hypothetical protein
VSERATALRKNPLDLNRPEKNRGGDRANGSAEAARPVGRVRSTGLAEQSARPPAILLRENWVQMF